MRGALGSTAMRVAGNGAAPDHFTRIPGSAPRPGPAGRCPALADAASTMPSDTRTSSCAGEVRDIGVRRPTSSSAGKRFDAGEDVRWRPSPTSSVSFSSLSRRDVLGADDARDAQVHLREIVEGDRSRGAFAVRARSRGGARRRGDAVPVCALARRRVGRRGESVASAAFCCASSSRSICFGSMRSSGARRVGWSARRARCRARRAATAARTAPRLGARRRQDRRQVVGERAECVQRVGADILQLVAPRRILRELPGPRLVEALVQRSRRA